MPYVPELLFLDGIRDEPRFQAVVEHIGLPSRTRS
jgi:hypothetical protein